ncbi:transmembrane protein 106A-like isoform X1 [Mesoplodon densirostris]|uniref:transmembrane protein 106A-like isoform X1 n=1 Tax=Mesoplodon densirostris TaxID=48708 RepID=UPI0028DAF8BC|nr:transmembrane protein 106A-like isoform X1 [Mesoplodon densirostris]XP_059937257.1 transmembrane protein 106A-like isoform X1 [Mesoplodon densirostris]XP_059937258.1 transmembrane protein 106A-like isoform X1 [Mesoplodon densirostris]XP_059937259.1 transmembrane protein 106A-like isoform X1 [Mesoplodon densirostris]
MGETFSQLGSREDEDKSILPSAPAFGSKAASYSSTTSSKAFCSCVPCERAAGVSFVTCPTCQGSGEIPREVEKQLVALIPYGDQRLKPRHTKLSVFLAVFICLVTSSLIVFFLFPRTIAVQPVGLNSSTVTVGEAAIHLNITNIVSISNNNYYPIAVTQLTIEVLHLSLVVGQVSDSLLLHIGPLASEQQDLYLAENQSPPRASAHPGHPDLFLPEPFRATGLPELRICGLPGKRIQAPLGGPSPTVTCLLSSSSGHLPAWSVSPTTPWHPIGRE